MVRMQSGVAQWLLSFVAILMCPGAALSAPHPQNAEELFRDCADCPAMVIIPAGQFAMGTDPAEAANMAALGAHPQSWISERPTRTVTVASFALARTEVTVAEFAAFVSATGYQPVLGCYVNDRGAYIFEPSASWQDPGFPRGPDHPVTCVSQIDAHAYVQWLSMRTGAVYRLPTEAEWEYAARAGARGISPWGTELELACARANVADQIFGFSPAAVHQFLPQHFPCSDGFAFTSPVGSFEANQLGLHDVLGNVWEWTDECFQMPASSQPCSGRVFRGGTFNDEPNKVRFAWRYGWPEMTKYDDGGFRLARTL